MDKAIYTFPQQTTSNTQNQTLNAIVFLYKQVLKIELGDFGHMERARRPEKLPTVMTKKEAGQVLAEMSGTYRLMAKLLYGCGIRLMECVRLRVKDVDFGQNQVIPSDCAISLGPGMHGRCIRRSPSHQCTRKRWRTEIALPMPDDTPHGLSRGVQAC